MLETMIRNYTSEIHELRNALSRLRSCADQAENALFQIDSHDYSGAEFLGNNSQNYESLISSGSSNVRSYFYEYHEANTGSIERYIRHLEKRIGELRVELAQQKEKEREEQKRK